MSVVDAAWAVLPEPLRSAMRRVKREVLLRRAYWRLTRVARNPRTYNEKIVWKMAHDRRPVLRRFADKVAARDYVAQVAGAHLLPRVHAVVADPAELDWAALPRQYALKVSHASGGVILVWDGAPREATLPEVGAPVEWERWVVHPDNADTARIESLCRQWLQRSFEWLPGRHPEWAYRRIPRRILVEELLTDAAGRLPLDYKFHMFDGVCRAVLVKSDQFAQARQDLMTAGWEPLPVTKQGIPRSDPPPPRPPALEAMLAVAEELSRGLDFVRVDLYALDERVVFGELTNYPAAAMNVFDPPDVDLLWGSYWTTDPHPWWRRVARGQPVGSRHRGRGGARRRAER